MPEYDAWLLGGQCLIQSHEVDGPGIDADQPVATDVQRPLPWPDVPLKQPKCRNRSVQLQQAMMVQTAEPVCDPANSALQ